MLFFLCGLAGSAMVATGLLLWTVARLPKGTGRPGASACASSKASTSRRSPGCRRRSPGYFLANRLLPVALPDRADWEVRTFFAVWLLVAGTAFLRTHRRVWPETLTVAAGLFGAVALADAGRGAALRLAGDGPGEPVFLAFDGAMLVVAALILFAARTIGRHDGPSRRVSARATGAPI